MDIDSYEEFISYLENRYSTNVDGFYYCEDTDTFFSAPEEVSYSREWGWEYKIEGCELCEVDLAFLSLELMKQVNKLKKR